VKGTKMRKPKEQKEGKKRVQVRNLPQQEKELKDREAENIKGGGGLSGGVVASYVPEDIKQPGS
jgi:hypothetical protein